MYAADSTVNIQEFVQKTLSFVQLVFYFLFIYFFLLTGIFYIISPSRNKTQCCFSTSIKFFLSIQAEVVFCSLYNTLVTNVLARGVSKQIFSLQVPLIACVLITCTEAVLLSPFKSSHAALSPVINRKKSHLHLFSPQNIFNEDGSLKANSY